MDAAGGAGQILEASARPREVNPAPRGESAPDVAMPPLPWGRRLRWLAAAVLTAAAAVVIFRTADGALLRDGIEEIARRPGLLALFVGGYAAAFALRAFAWRALLGRSGNSVAIGRLFAILHASLFANHALPVKAGEVLRPFLGARAGIPIADATVSTALARVLDVAALLAIAAALLPLTAGSEGVAVLAVPALLLAIVGGALLWLRTTTLASTRIPPLDRLWTRAREALRALPPRAVLRAFALTVPGWLLESVVV